jgi:hypothetical protein
MEKVVISTQIRIQQYEDYWYTVEDTHIDVGCEGFTVSYWEYDKEKGEKRVQHICMNKEESLAIADAIYKLFKN